MQNKKRILIKLSGESFAHGSDKFNIARIKHYAKQIAFLHNQGYEIGIVVGGGNLWRGTNAKAINLDRSQADYIGMMGTIMNGMVLQQVLENTCEVNTRTLSAIRANSVVEPYIKRRAVRHLEKRRVIIFVAGTGSPFFSTDTAAALRACEIGASKILIAKNGVDGVYDKDPLTNQDAKRYDNLTYQQVITQNIKVMDKTSITMCAENNITLLVFSAEKENSIVKVLNNAIKYTKIHN